MRYFSSHIILFTHALNEPKDEAAVGLYLVLLYLSHVSGRKFLASQFLFFGLFKNKKHQPLLLLSGYFSKLSNWMISDNRGIYGAHVTENDRGRARISALQPQARGRPRLTLGVQAMTQCQHFVRRVWFYCEVNCMSRVTNKTQKCLLEIDTTLSSSKATGRDWEASCAGLSSGHKGSSLMGQVLGVLCDHLSPF